MIGYHQPIRSRKVRPVPLPGTRNARRMIARLYRIQNIRDRKRAAAKKRGKPKRRTR